MAQVVMHDAICADFLARSIKRLLTFADTEYFRIERFALSVAAHSSKQRTSIWNQRNTAHFPILRSGCCVATHNDFASVKIHVAPFEGVCLALTHSSKRQARRKVSAVSLITTVSSANLC